MNMQLSRVRRTRVVVLAVCLTAIPALAGGGAKPDAKQDKKERIEQLLAKPEVLFGNDFDIRALKAPERRAMSVYRFEREVRQLHQILLSQLELTDLQKKAIRKIVDDQIEYAQRTGGSPRTFSGRQRDPLAAPGSPNAPIGPVKEMADPTMAKNAKGTDRVRERNRPSVSMFDDPTAFVNLLMAELSGDQIEQFKRLAYRWETLRPFGAADGLLRQLVRAVRDPGLKIEKEQRESADKRVQQAMMNLGRDRQYADKRLEAYEKAKADIAANLTPDQREHFENTLKQLQTEFAEEVLLIMDMRAKNKIQDETESDTDAEKPTD